MFHKTRWHLQVAPTSIVVGSNVIACRTLRTDRHCLSANGRRSKQIVFFVNEKAKSYIDSSVEALLCNNPSLYEYLSILTLVSTKTDIDAAFYYFGGLTPPKIQDVS
jgi:hypothetical protein